MKIMIETMDAGGYSCVIRGGDGSVRCFSRRGVIDLYTLLREEPVFLRGATVVDKVVGKGAAVVAATAGVRELYSHVISKGAYELLVKEGVEVSYGVVVPNIINRSGDDICPLEKRCGDTCTLEELMTIVDRFIEEIVLTKK